MTEQNPKLERIKKRPDYLAVANTRRKWVTPSFILQAKPGEGDSPPRAGFTTSKKVGNAVARNRAKRRLREVARLVLPTHGRAGWDYVLIGRAEATASRDFAALQKDLIYALKKIHGSS